MPEHLARRGRRQPRKNPQQRGFPGAGRSQQRDNRCLLYTSYPRQIQFAPSLKLVKAKHVAHFFQIRGYRHRSRNYVEQDVPPVSYTHLDDVDIASGSPFELASKARRVIGRTVRLPSIDEPGPVSYTHLDVYKRQVPG